MVKTKYKNNAVPIAFMISVEKFPRFFLLSLYPFVKVKVEILREFIFIFLFIMLGISTYLPFRRYL